MQSIHANNFLTLHSNKKKKQETKEIGTLSSDVLTSYWKSTGGVLGFVVLLSVLLMQVTRNLSDAWLAHWVSSNTTQNTTDNATEFYLKVYTFIAVSNSAITFVRAFLFAFAGIKAAKFIHNKLLTRVFYVSFEMHAVASTRIKTLPTVSDEISFFRYHSTRTTTESILFGHIHSGRFTSVHFEHFPGSTGRLDWYTVSWL